MSYNAPYLIIGKNGQVASALADILKQDAVCISSRQCDLTEVNAISDYLSQYQPKVIINAAAYTAVDNAEDSDQQRIANLVNGKAAQKIAEHCQNNNIILIHYSTDYVFDGEASVPYNENQYTNPQGVYGQTKLAGENFIREVLDNYIILRTAWVYDSSGKNFLNTMLRLAKDHETLNVVADQIGTPTSARLIAGITKHIIDVLESGRTDCFGTYHLTAAGKTSWHGFASLIVELAKQLEFDIKATEVKPIATSDYPTKAKRPKYSVLDISKLENTFNIKLPSWDEDVINIMKEKKRARS